MAGDTSEESAFGDSESRERFPKARPRAERPPRGGFVQGPHGPVRTSQPDTLQDDLRSNRDNGRPPLRVRISAVALDEASFAMLVRIDQLLLLRERLHDDAFVLDEIENLFANNFRSALS
jgi:hypothetical protein